MKEITRIHIAKISYDIEISAKKALEKYLRTLESYSDDAEIISDIEIRMTELLEERGVKKGGVISDSDVAALEEQLGAPSEIMGGGDIAIGTDGEAVSRKLFRDTDNPILGGVMSGIAYFFGINPLWARLVFLILAIASFGTALLVYVVLWIAVPPAKTAADKLQMRGRSVTAASIREFNENEATKPLKESGTSGRRILTILIGITSVLGAAGAAALTIAAVVGVLVHGREDLFMASDAKNFFIAAFSLMVTSGVLLTVLCSLGAYASFAQKLTKRVWVAMIVVVLLGMTAFGGAIGLAQYGKTRQDAAVQSQMKTVDVVIPSNSVMATGLDLDTPNVRVVYSVTSDTPSASLRTPSSEDGKVTVSLSNTTLRVQANGYQTDSDCRAFWCRDMQPVLTISGPALSNMQLSSDSIVEYVPISQKQLAVKTAPRSYLSIESGTIERFTLAAEADSIVRMSRASVSSIVATMGYGAELSAGIIEQFTLTIPKACPDDGGRAIIDINRITGGTMMVNGESVRSEMKTMACANVIIDNEDER